MCVVFIEWEDFRVTVPKPRTPTHRNLANLNTTHLNSVTLPLSPNPETLPVLVPGLPGTCTPPVNSRALV